MTLGLCKQFLPWVCQLGVTFLCIFKTRVPSLTSLRNDSGPLLTAVPLMTRRGKGMVAVHAKTTSVTTTATTS